MRILAAIDGSEAANRAVELAARLARDLKARLKIINVVSEGDVNEDQLSEYAHSEHHSTSAEALNVLSEDKLRMARQRAEALGVTEVESASLPELEAGAIAETIIDTAQGDDADMIVMGKRGLGRLTGLLAGSVSQKVMCAASCAVIVVP